MFKNSMRLGFILVATAIVACGPSQSQSLSPSNLTATTDQPIHLVRASAERCPPVSGCTLNEFFQVLIEVRNLAYQKKVGAVLHLPQGDQTIEAHYLRDSGAHNELWAIQSMPPWRGFEFHLSYQVAGTTYIDDNQGKLYQIKPYGSSRLLGEPAVVLDDTFSLMGRGGEWSGLVDTDQGPVMKGWILLRDWRQGSTLDAVFTTNHWQTTYEQNIAAPTMTTNQPVKVPFEFAMPAVSDRSMVEVAFRWHTPEFTAWDNNYGQNYHIDRRGGFLR